MTTGKPQSGSGGTAPDAFPGSPAAGPLRGGVASGHYPGRMVAALVIDCGPGHPATIREPVPAVAILTLSALLSARVREWMDVRSADVVELCGHRFTIRSWQTSAPPSGLVVEHTCGACP